MATGSSVRRESGTVPLLVNDINQVLDPLLDGDSAAARQGTRVYCRRWIVLLEFSLLAFIQGVVWNTWGSISSSAKVVFPGWTDATIALLSNWGNICFIMFLLPVVWVVDTKGLRVATLLSAALTLVGAGMRCFTMDPVAETWLIHFGHVLNGVSGIVVFGAPPQVSAAWFPPNQRTTATSLIYVVGLLGVAVGSILPPFLVNEINDSSSSQDKHITSQQVIRLMYIQTIFAGVMFLWILIHFPSKPPSPPSISAWVDRVSFTNGLKLLSKNGNIWLVGLAFGLSQAVYASWVTVIHINLKDFGIDQKEAGWISFYSIIGGCAGSILASSVVDDLAQARSVGLHRRLGCLLAPCESGTRLLRYADKILLVSVDYLGGRMKIFLFTGLIGSTLCFLYFLGICLTVLPASKLALYSSVILGGAFNTGLQPVFIELGAEVGYPITEGVVGGFLTGIFNVIGAIFLLLFFIPDIGYIWMNWCLIGSTLIAIPFLAFVNEHYARSNVDHQDSSYSTSD